MNFLHTVYIYTIVPSYVKKGDNFQFEMFEFCHILTFGHAHKLRNIMINLKIFDRKCHTGSVGYKPGPNPPPPPYLKFRKKMSSVHKKSDRQKELKCQLQSDRHCFLVGSLRCDSSRFFSEWNLPRFAAICRDPPRDQPHD